MITMTFSEVLVFWGVPTGLVTAILGLGVWFIKRQITKNDSIREAKEAEKEAARKQAEEEKENKAIEREQHREKLLLMLMQSIRATTTLSEATARAVQRIPDAKCNGDMTKALDYAVSVQMRQKDFLMELGIHSIYDT